MRSLGLPGGLFGWNLNSGSPGSHFGTLSGFSGLENSLLALPSGRRMIQHEISGQSRAKIPIRHAKSFKRDSHGGDAMAPP